MGTPQKGYGDHKNRSGGVGWDRREQTKSSLMLQTEAVTLERRPSRLRGSKDEICPS